ncbi:hypothetical protein Fmac_022829 [Flemingia macrophylla]|uniref:TMEM205-like domain-containing protein n=1 Tax=Flemingia macrophylla TaxID=520843 RepID=A0ABD1M183_9FABA
MNVLGLSLVLTSLAAAGLFSPSPSPSPSSNPTAQNTIVKEGHRVVVVEYDQGAHHNTKISISPEDTTTHHVLDHPKETASILPTPTTPFTKDLICDAYGKCKHKISDAMEKTKDKAQEALHKKKEEVHATKEAARHAADTVSDTLGKTNEYVKDTVETAKDHVAGNVTEAKDAFKRVAMGLGSLSSLASLTGVANLLGFATAYGMCVWVTFISSYVLARAMPRQQFALVQSKIYPVYFRAMAYCITLALFGHVFTHRKTLVSNKADMFQLYNLVASLLTLLVNSLYLEPRATKLMFERIKIEKEEGRGREDISISGRPDPKDPSSTTADQDAVRSRIIKLNDKLKKLNSYSSLLNILNLILILGLIIGTVLRKYDSTLEDGLGDKVQFPLIPIPIPDELLL